MDRGTGIYIYTRFLIYRANEITGIILKFCRRFLVHIVSSRLLALVSLLNFFNKLVACHKNNFKSIVQRFCWTRDLDYCVKIGKNAPTKSLDKRFRLLREIRQKRCISIKRKSKYITHSQNVSIFRWRKGK